jgi:hypothetical protein
VLATVEFDYEPRARAREVRDEISDWELPPEAELGESSRSETRP